MKTQTNISNKVLDKSIMPHARRMRKQFIMNERIIMEELGLSEDEYRETVFDCGMAFLEMFYDLNNPEQRKWIERFATDKSLGFWTWWKGEWRVREHAFLRAFRKRMTLEDWQIHNHLHTTGEHTQQAFYNFIKHKNLKV